MRIKTKKKGVILLEAIFALILLGMVSYGFAATSTLQYQQLDAVKVAAQAREYAEVEAKYIQALGFYDVDDGIDPDGIHSKKTMESLIGTDEGGNWQSETKLVSTKLLPGFTEDEDVNKIKVISIDVYKTGESMPRFSLSVPLSLQDSSYGVPIGTVMAWPLSEAPKGLHEDRWLECNGQNVDSSKYPRLAKLMSQVPDYRGMFLRGLGNQNYSQNNGGRQDSNTTYSSGGLGETQGDSIRHWIAMTHSSPSDHFVADEWKWGYYGSAWEKDNITYVKYYVGYDGNSSISMPYADGGGWISGDDHSAFFRTISGQELQDGWSEALKKITYIPHITYGSFEGGSYVSDISFEEKYEYPTLTVNTSDVAEVFDSALSNPISNEIRPVNKAVRYMIKAK